MKEYYTTYEDIHRLIGKIAADIKKDKWECDLIVGIASGGLIPARLMKNHLKKDIYIVGLKRYKDEKEIFDLPLKIQWIDEVEKKIANKKVLLIDEIDDTRLTMTYCLNELLKNNPKEIRVAVIHEKIKEKKSEYPEEIKHVYIGERIEDLWMKYPWDAVDLSEYYKSAREQKENNL
jgi:uncharacterized protein